MDAFASNLFICLFICLFQITTKTTQLIISKDICNKESKYVYRYIYVYTYSYYRVVSAALV